VAGAEAGPDPVGRDDEIDAIRTFLAATARAPTALAITGGIGTGKIISPEAAPI
jgi:hypothetical protein